MDGLVFVLDDVTGFKDVKLLFGDAADFDQKLKARTGNMVSYAHCDLQFARDIVSDALAIHEASGQPFPGRYLLYRHCLGPTPLLFSRRRPNLGAYMTETFVRGPELATGSEFAVADPIYCELLPDSSEQYNFVRRHAKKGAQGPEDCKDRLSLPKEAFEEFISKLASKGKDVLTRHLAVNLEVEALAGRSSTRASRAAARALVALEENLAPFETIKFARLICAHWADSALDFIERGYLTLEQAMSAGTDRDTKEMEGEPGEIGGKR